MCMPQAPANAWSMLPRSAGENGGSDIAAPPARLSELCVYQPPNVTASQQPTNSSSPPFPPPSPAMAPAAELMRSAAPGIMARALRTASPSALRPQPAALAALAARSPTAPRRTFTNFPQSSSSSASNSSPGSIFGLPGVGGGPGGGAPPSYFQRPSLPANTIVRFVPQQTAWIVERMGKFNRILQPGLAVLIPFLDRIAYVKSLKEAAIEIPSQSAITADNVTLELDGVLYTRVFDAYKAR